MSSPDRADYDAILEDLDGDGSASDPYLVTDVIQLQAIEAALDAHVRLDADIDARATASWNESTAVEGDLTGPAHDTKHPLAYPNVDPDSIELYTQEGSGTDREWTSVSVDFEFDTRTGSVVLDEPVAPDDSAIRAEYSLREPVARGFEPIGTSGSFTGVFDGAGHTIRNLRIARRVREPLGLFEFVTDGDAETVIRDVRLESVELRGADQIGALVGQNRARIRNVAVDGAVSKDPRSGLPFGTGGVVGYSVRGTVAGCESTVDVVGAPAGGVVGRLGMEADAVRECHAAGTVGGASGDAGGIVGRARGGEIVDSSTDMRVEAADHAGGMVGHTEGAVTGCEVRGTVVGGSAVGGVAARLEEGSIARSLVTATVESASVAGGIAGRVEAGGSVTDCCGLADLQGETSTGGIVGVLTVSDVERVLAAGPMQGTESVGGVVGTVDGEGVFDDGTARVRVAYWDVDATDQDDGVGTRNQGEGTIEIERLTGHPTDILQGESPREALSGLDFAGPWTGGDDGSYPRPRLDEPVTGPQTTSPSTATPRTTDSGAPKRQSTTPPTTIRTDPATSPAPTAPNSTDTTGGDGPGLGIGSGLTALVGLAYALRRSDGE